MTSSSVSPHSWWLDRPSFIHKPCCHLTLNNAENIADRQITMSKIFLNKKLLSDSYERIYCLLLRYQSCAILQLRYYETVSICPTFYRIIRVRSYYLDIIKLFSFIQDYQNSQIEIKKKASQNDSSTFRICKKSPSLKLLH